ncbi:MAG: hypothetical protein IJ787_04770 [Bacilli bacterium]|nr:hypothetical protein [Bacilli bacterium]
MLYCCHCGYRLDEEKVEERSPSLANLGETEIQEGAKVAYVCPQCGHLITADSSEEDVKALSRAAHAQMQRSRNAVASGMGSVCVGTILLIIAIMFFFLAKKPAEGHRLITTCPEFFVSMTLFGISAVLLAVGAVFLYKGLKKHVIYSRLLKDINNRTFVQ